MRVFLDDIRALPQGYDKQTYTAKETISLLQTGEVAHISLDHDLGGENDIPEEICGTGYDVAKWIEEHAFLGDLPRLTWNVHSANPVGVRKMIAALMNADKYWDR